MRYQIIPVTSFQQNCSLLWCERSRKCAIVDPGGEIGKIIAAIESQELIPERILITHGHIDHAGGAAALAKALGVVIEGPHQEDRFWLENMPQQAEIFGFPQVETFTPERWLEQGDRVTVGDEQLEVIHTPGHTPGHLTFYHAPSKLALVGDVIFQGSIGRTDFPRSDYATLIRSIRERLWPLGDDCRFVPGHGPESTFGEERLHNPFLRD
ncbi:MBL fold metallo-hydrolase [Candidatus Endoriftia persephone]|jgi:glyoxylase-like metal-dependent hydrolase (beta-lactamase superfamily II)|uniref:Hydroxyacylglutathione hydrolase n=3 Tax=Gammaproteobacteria TaxID=1236 RepID=G2FII3_9GAMM|nr:MBL fold metallo-hydrolase [Candidatus Endoriftia persephone]EGV51002.1 hydroxyacylglutathione hydrolase [endosymbiont of Riftia pachyptila (vent Ph05)]EGW53373.1 hydroxyacylglutathione hydrolase [endosymbiont of Tevnia jerichonana (vent Tica)]USF87124.1 MBL fold metallo-hydrolase [Candidatus Endoriftia persephone]